MLILSSLYVTRTYRTEENSAGNAHFTEEYFQTVLRTNNFSIFRFYVFTQSFFRYKNRVKAECKAEAWQSKAKVNVSYDEYDGGVRKHNGIV